MASFSRSDMTPEQEQEHGQEQVQEQEQHFEPVHDYLHRLCSINLTRDMRTLYGRMSLGGWRR